MAGAPVKRGPGRPRKNPLPVAAGADLSSLDGIAPRAVDTTLYSTGRAEKLVGRPPEFALGDAGDGGVGDAVEDLRRLVVVREHHRVAFALEAIDRFDPQQSEIPLVFLWRADLSGDVASGLQPKAANLAG